jgi:3-deoxy-D-arabino-heptulosonate 7-phosphate (DAHP) synthase
MKMLQNIQSTNEAKLIQLSAGGKQRTKKRMHRQLDSLQQLKTRFRNGTLNVVDYADAASHLLHID